MKEHGFQGFFRTSALTGEGVKELGQTLRESIDWDKIPVVGSNRLFTAIREFIAVLKEKRETGKLATVRELYVEFCEQSSHSPREQEFNVCLQRMEQTNTVEILVFSSLNEESSARDYVLLAPEYMDSYASAIVMAARDEPDGIGHLPEASVLNGDFSLEPAERLPEQESERKVLVAVVEQFLTHEIALRENIDGMDYLVFPSQYTREAPFPGSTSYGLSYDFKGPVKNIFTTLVVRLSHHSAFQNREFYCDAACFEPMDGGRCIILFQDLKDGVGRMTVFFEDRPSQHAQCLFLEYVYLHLQRNALPQSITRRRAYHCPECGYLFDEEVVERRLKSGIKDITCSSCDAKSPLFELLLADDESLARDISRIDEDARVSMRRELAVSSIQGKKRTGDFDLMLLYDPRERTRVLEVAEALKSLGLRAWLDVWNIAPGLSWLDAMHKAKERTRMAAVCAGPSGFSFLSKDERKEAAGEFFGPGKKGLFSILLPGMEGKPKLPSFFKQLPWTDISGFGPDTPEPFNNLVSGILGYALDARMGQNVETALSTFEKEKSGKTPGDAGPPLPITLPLGKKIKSSLGKMEIEAVRLQLAELLNMPSAFIRMAGKDLKTLRLTLEFDRVEDTLRLFAMARGSNRDLVEWFEKWFIDPRAFINENVSTEKVVREAAGGKKEAGAVDLAPSEDKEPPYAISRLELQNFKCFDYLRIDFNSHSSLPGRWVCLAGINGAGKSSILQAICLVLLGDRSAQELGGDLLKRMRRRESGVERDAKINVWLKERGGREEQFVELMLTRLGTAPSGANGNYDRAMVDFWETMKNKVVLSYGATRNLSAKRDTQNERLSMEARRQITLFDPLAQLESAEALLHERSSESAFMKLFQELLRRVFGEEIGFKIDGRRIMFTVEEEPVEAVELPDGFRSSVAWLADLCDVWCEKFPDVAQAGDPADIEAIILIDEIDLHLHPSLQRSLVPSLREALPKVHWIVSTHSPLVLSSFDSAEIVALDRKEEGGVRKLDRQILGFSTDQIYHWLMGTPATSAALESRLGKGKKSEEADEEMAEILEMSPEVNEEEARLRVKNLMSRIRKSKRRNEES